MAYDKYAVSFQIDLTIAFMVHLAMAHAVVGLYSHRLYGFGLHSDGLCSYGLYSHAGATLRGKVRAKAQPCV